MEVFFMSETLTEEKKTEDTAEDTVKDAKKDPAAVPESPEKPISEKPAGIEHITDCPFAEHLDLSDFDYDFTKEDYILMRLRDEDLMEYLRMQERKEAQIHEEKEKRNSRIYSILQILIVSLAIVLIVWFLKDNPTVLINILYIGGILLFVWFWKRSKSNPTDSV